MTRARRMEVMLATSWAMTASTIQLFVIAVLAARLIDDLDVSRGQLGLLGAINTGIGALVAPRLGRLTDAIGIRRAMTLLLVAAASGLALTALARTFWLLIGASAVSGLSQGASNPVTNRVIAGQVPAAQQGLVTGVKQSGVQFAGFLAGATMPGAAASVGWRPALGLFAVFTLLTAVLAWVRFAGGDGDSGERTPTGTTTTAAPTTTAGAPGPTLSAPAAPAEATRFVRRVALYAFFLGMAAGGTTRFYPLYAQEVLGYSETTAGLAASVTRLAAIVARVAWVPVVDRWLTMGRALQIMAIGSAVTSALLLVSERGLPALLWPTVVLLAFTMAAWNVIAMLAVIRSTPAAASGQATGVVLLGFLGGLTIAAPATGWAVDTFGSYQPAWICLGLLSLAGALVVRSPAPARTASPIA